MRPIILAILVGSASTLLQPNITYASGSYVALPIRPPAGESRSPLYELGKQVFNGRLELGPVDPAKVSSQQEELALLDSKLASRGVTETTLSPLAGKLTTQQLQALKIYVSERYQR
jgi:hypothetical protein